ncbi:MAG TPA: CHAT domain-containing protein [Candidatus Wunengus sp. YC63]|uniref:CHAT domain-containing protein n=1 Tax=Candidatus Wunengus sp. YC63 TaxID=3367699 RepID=UPI004029D94F
MKKWLIVLMVIFAGSILQIGVPTAFSQSKDEAIKLYQQGMDAYNYGRYQEALEYYERSFKINRSLNDSKGVAINLNAIGLVYGSLGRYENALKYYEESLKIFKELNIPQHITTSLNNIGLVYIHLKDYTRAEELFKEAEKKEKSIGLERGINHSMVELYLATKRYYEALRLLENRTPSLSDTPNYQIGYFTQRGHAFKGNKRLKEASRDFLKAAILIEEMRSGIKGEKAGFLGTEKRIKVYHGLFSSLSERALKGEKKDTDFDNYGKDLASAAFYFAESTKARVLLEAMAESARKSRHVGIPEGLREKEQSLLNQISAIDSQWEDVYKKGEDVLKTFKERRDGLTAELNTLINELRQKYPAYTALYYPKPVPPEELPLKDNEILLEYAMSDDACYLFVVRKGGVKSLLSIPFGKEALESKVQEFVDAIKDPVHKKFPIKTAKELHDILLGRALKDVKEGDKVIIVPDGILGALPFESLVIKEGNSINDSLYAGDVYTLSYYQSASVLSMLRHLKQEKAKRPLFALGNPVYSVKDGRYIAYKEGKAQPVKLAQQGDHAAFRAMVIESKWGKTTKDDKNADELAFKPLPETEDEVRAVAELFDVQPQPPDVLLGINANETNLRKSPLNEYRYLHFATHADLPGKVQGIKEPFLLLGQVENKGKDDGFLTMSEVLDLELNAEMVVLSACVTGRGKVMEGEGVMNFARAFQHAGARSVLVSLWDVASKEAVEYMEIFYKHVKDGKNRTDAMKLARKEIKSRYPHPFYWSVFVLYGEG